MEETKYVDLGATTYDADTGGELTCICSIPEGTSVSERIGKRVRLASLESRGLVVSRSTAEVNDVVHYIVYDRYPLGGLPAITDIVEAAHPRAFLNDDNLERFIILREQHIMLFNNPSTFTEGFARGVYWYLDLENLGLEFDSDGAGDITHQVSGALYSLWIGDHASTEGADATVAYRVRFYDQQ